MTETCFVDLPQQSMERAVETRSLIGFLIAQYVLSGACGEPNGLYVYTSCGSRHKSILYHRGGTLYGVLGLWGIETRHRN
jgi:hypothetical protein